MPVILRWILAFGAAAAVTLTLFAAMPVFLRMNDPEAGEELAAILPRTASTLPPDFDLYAEAPCWGSSLTWCDYYWDLRDGRIEGTDSYRSVLDWYWQAEGEPELLVNRMYEQAGRERAGQPCPFSGCDLIPPTRCFLVPAYPVRTEFQEDGEVVLRFDRTGSGEMVNVTIDSATHPEFEAAMQAALLPCRTTARVTRSGETMTVYFRLD